MSLIRPDDHDFRVCFIDLDVLVELQLDDQRHGWSTRWTSVDALRSQVKPNEVLLQTFLRQDRGDGVQTHRCLVLFSALAEDTAGGITTIDVDPQHYATWERIDSGVTVGAAFAEAFALATGGIAMLPKK